MHWYSVDTPDEADRLDAAWSDAPTDNLELCGFLMDTARLQVLAYAPDSEPATYEPTTLTWANGWTLDLTRDGDVVTAVLTSSGAAPVTAALPLPAQFQVRGAVYVTEYNSVTTPTVILSLNDIPAAGELGALHAGAAAAGVVLTAQWLGDPAPGDGVPFNYVYAQLQQAKNIYNAGRIVGEANGPDGFAFVPRPLSREIQRMIRPQSGVANVF